MSKRQLWNDRYAGKELIWSMGPNALFASEVTGLNPGKALDAFHIVSAKVIERPVMNEPGHGKELKGVALDSLIRATKNQGTTPNSPALF